MPSFHPGASGTRLAQEAGCADSSFQAMSDVARLKRVLLSLSELGLRIDWLKEHLRRWPTADACRLLNQLCEESERSDPAAREAQLALALAFVSLPDQEREGAYQFARGTRLLSLERMLRRSPSNAPPPQERPSRTTGPAAS